MSLSFHHRSSGTRHTMLNQEDLSPTDTELLRLLKVGRITAPYAAGKLDYSKQHVRDRLRRLVEHGHVAKVHQGLYELLSDPRTDVMTYQDSASVVEKALWEIKREAQREEPEYSAIQSYANRGLESIEEILDTDLEIEEHGDNRDDG